VNDRIEALVLRSTGATSVCGVEVIQQLWSGYGHIVRYNLEGADIPAVIVKQVVYDDGGDHPRGWSGDIGHRRKLRSYQVESTWYKQWANQCNEACRVAHCLALETTHSGMCLVLEDLDASGWGERRSAVTDEEFTQCLQWLASFHATFLGEQPEGLWETGTYWHLATRPEELQALDDLPLREAAHVIDRLLSESPFQTLVHGDAKVANFCFPNSGAGPVAAVDFQYVGGGCGMKDLAYFVGSVFRDEECGQRESDILDSYFYFLRRALSTRNAPVDADALEMDWRRLYPVAWTDFHRFLKGWSPEHWKLSSYSEQVATGVITRIKPASL
jgi:hypothetical protein